MRVTPHFTTELVAAGPLLIIHLLGLMEVGVIRLWSPETLGNIGAVP